MCNNKYRQQSRFITIESLAEPLYKAKTTPELSHWYSPQCFASCGPQTGVFRTIGTNSFAIIVHGFLWLSQ